MNKQFFLFLTLTLCLGMLAPSVLAIDFEAGTNLTSEDLNSSIVFDIPVIVNQADITATNISLDSVNCSTINPFKSFNLLIDTENNLSYISSYCPSSPQIALDDSVSRTILNLIVGILCLVVLAGGLVFMYQSLQNGATAKELLNMFIFVLISTILTGVIANIILNVTIGGS